MNVRNVNSFDVAGLDEDTNYFYRVRVIKSCGTRNSNVILTTPVEIPTAPNANVATNIFCRSFDTNWDVVTGVGSYRVEVASDADFMNIFVDQTVMTNTLNIAANIEPGTNYFYRIYSLIPCKESLASSPINLSTSSADCQVDNINCLVFTKNIISKTDPDCSDDNGEFDLQITSSTNAGIQVVFDASSGLNTFSVASPQNTLTINVTGVGAEAYNYEISDGLRNICPLEESFVELNPYETLKAVLVSTTSIVCPSELGVAVFTDFSPSGNYFYSIDGSPPSIPLEENNEVLGLPAGVSTVKIGESGDACPFQQDIIILDISPKVLVNATITPASCSAADGRVVINTTGVTGGSGNYIHFAFGPMGVPNPDEVTLPFYRSKLAAGQYEFTVTDDTNCANVIPIEISEPDQARPTITLNEPNCSTTGSIHVGFDDSVDSDRILSGRIMYTMTLMDMDKQVLETQNSNGSLLNYSFNDLWAGTYILITSNSVDPCAREEIITLAGSVSISFEYELQCVDANELGLHLFNIEGEAEVDYLLEVRDENDFNVVSPGITISLASGIQKITIKEEAFLSTKNEEYTLRLVQKQTTCTGEEKLFYDAPDELLIFEQLSVSKKETTPSLPDEPTGSITISGLGGGSQPKDNPFPYLIKIELKRATVPGQGLETNFDRVPVNSQTLQFEKIYDDIPSGVYEVEVVDHAGCGINFEVEVAIDTSLFIPNIFTPNGDNVNETFFIRNLSEEEDHLVISNRWGREVFSSTNYKNDWDGGKETEGIYFYVLSTSESKNYTGWVELVR